MHFPRIRQTLLDLLRVCVGLLVGDSLKCVVGDRCG